MLTYDQLSALHRSLRDRRVLSVYIDGTANDTAIQRAWRTQLDHSIDDLRRWLEGSPRGEREQFEECVRQLQTSLERFTNGIGAPGWATFITEEAVHYDEPLPTAEPTFAAWSTGPCLAPYVNALKETHPVIVVLADSRRADIYRYQLGELTRVDVLRAYTAMDRPEHMGDAPRPGFHTGTRGSTGSDDVQRTLLHGRNRMLDDAARRASELAGNDGWILLGGVTRVTTRLAERLEGLAPRRVLTLDSLDIHASEAEIAAAAREGASDIRDRIDEDRVAEITDMAFAQTLGAIGPVETREALERSSVRDLYVTHHYVEDHAADAESAIRAALDQDALIEEVSGRAAERLDRFGGIAAGLRFRAQSATDVSKTQGRESAS